MTTYVGIKRSGPPQAIQKLREGLYMVQITLSETPSADWKRLFYETQQSPAAGFSPRAVDISGNFVRFRAEIASVEAGDGLGSNRWIERAKVRKNIPMGGKLDEERLSATRRAPARAAGTDGNQPPLFGESCNRGGKSGACLRAGATRVTSKIQPASRPNVERRPFQGIRGGPRVTNFHGHHSKTRLLRTARSPLQGGAEGNPPGLPEACPEISSGP